MPFNWICPHCNRAQTVVSERSRGNVLPISLNGLFEGRMALSYHAIACSNSDCERLTLTVSLAEYRIRGTSAGNVYELTGNNSLFSSRVYPRSEAKPQPDFIPAPLREDYFEACLIKDDSPKASATLARRCLQGMIRDFAGIQRPTLIQEIDALRKALDEDKAPRGVTPETIEAIDHVRRLGNIGAHMEKDINLVVPVDPGEAQALIELIELLFDEWYVAQHTRQERLRRIAQIRAAKDQIKLGPAGGENDGSAAQAPE